MSETDLELLARYARLRAEDAFAEVVRRHLNLVHSAALRQVRSRQFAEEVTQSVFMDLARKAGQLKPDTILSAWLYQVTRRTAIDVIRREVSRQLREQIATEMNATNATVTSTDWTQIELLLDDAMHVLDDMDRAAVLLRYFENKSIREVGQTLGTSENAAQKRLSRAVERLREFFAKRGITIGASGLVAAISAHAIQAAPVGLSATISAAAALAIAGTAVVTSVVATATKAIVMTAMQKTLITAAVIVATVTTPWVLQHRTQAKLENLSLRQQLNELAQRVAENERRAPKRALDLRLPAPRMQAAAAPVEPMAENVRPPNLIARLLQQRDGDRLLQLREGERPPRLVAAQVENYLKENRRNAASLLAAYRTTGDLTLLQEAAQMYPDDPQVNFAAIFKSDSSPEERRRQLEAFTQSASRNALANYLSALEYFQTGQADQAVQELSAAAGKSQFQDYSSAFAQDDEEAWRAAGYSEAEAKTVTSFSKQLPHLADLKRLSQETVALANSYRQAGDEASAEAALRAGLNLGRRLDASPGEALISQLIGLAIQGQALGAMNPSSSYDGSGQTVQDRLGELTSQRGEIKKLVQQFDGVQPRMSNQDWISYNDRWKAFGEEAALRWVVSKYGPG